MVVPVTANVEIVETGAKHDTPFIIELAVGTYTLKATFEGQVQEKTVNIVEGELTKVDFNFEEVVETGIVKFEGVVSGQAEAGELVTITVVRPDTTTEEVLTMTNEDLTFSVEYENVSGDYLAKVRIEADAEYEAAESEEIAFSIGKKPRTITLTVTPL